MKTLSLFFLLLVCSVQADTYTIQTRTDIDGVPTRSFANVYMFNWLDTNGLPYPGSFSSGSFSFPDGATEIQIQVPAPDPRYTGTYFVGNQSFGYLHGRWNLDGRWWPTTYIFMRHVTLTGDLLHPYNYQSFYGVPGSILYVPPATNRGLFMVRGKKVDGSTGVIFLHAKKKSP